MKFWRAKAESNAGTAATHAAIGGEVGRVLAETRRRAMVASLVSSAGRTLAVGAGAAALGVGLVKLVPQFAEFEPSWPLVAGAAVGVGLVAALAMTWLARWSSVKAATELDARLHSKDRLTNALLLSRDASDPFARLAINDAQSHAQGINAQAVRAAVPVRWTAAWPIAGVLIAGTLGVGMFVPPRQPAAEAMEVAAADARAQQIVEDAREAVVAARETIDSAPIDPASTPEIEAIEALEKELQAGGGQVAEKAALAAGALDSLAEKVEATAQDRLTEADELRESLAKAAPGADERGADAAPSASDPMLDALRRGDLEQAANEAEKLANAADRLSPEERRRAAEQLREFADALNEQERARAADQARTEERAGSSSSDAAPPEAKRPNSSASNDETSGKSEPSAPQTPPQPSSEQPPAGKAGDAASPPTQPPQSQPSSPRTSEENSKPQESGAQSERERMADAARRASEELSKPPESRPGSPQDQTQDRTSERNSPSANDGARQGSEQQRTAKDGQPKPRNEPTQNGQTQERDANGAKGEQTPPAATPPSGSPNAAPQQVPNQNPASGSPREQQQNQGQPPADAKDRQGNVPSERQQTSERDSQPKSEQQPQESPTQRAPGQPSNRGNENAPSGRSEKQGQSPSSQPPDENGRGQQGQTDPGSTPAQGTGETETPDGQGKKSVGESRNAAAPRAATDPNAPKQPQGAPTPGQNPDVPQSGRDSTSPAPEGEGGMRELAERLRAAENNRRAGERDAKSAEDLRRRAEELYNAASPEERRRMEQLAREMQQGKGAGGDAGFSPGGNRPGDPDVNSPGPEEWTGPTRSVDATGGKAATQDTGRDLVLSEIEAGPEDPAVPRAPGARGIGENGAARVRDAVRGAERAIEQDAVPRRHREMVRRVFQRINEKAGQAPAVAPLAPDAVPRSQRTPPASGASPAPKAPDAAGGQPK